MEPRTKRIAGLLLYAVTALAVSACAGGAGPANSPAPVDGLSLDEGIARIAADLEAGLPENTRIAVVNFESPSARFSDYVLEELQGLLVNNKRLVVTDRSNLELRRNELNFQMSGEVSDESAVSIGHALGARVIVTGGITDIGGAYRCRFNAIDVEQAVRRASPAVTIRNDRTVAYMLPQERPALATTYFNSGFAHYEAGRYAQAAADFTRALEVKADDKASLYYRAWSYNDLKDYDGAIADAGRLIRMQPDNADNHFLRGYAYVEKGEYDKAMADYNHALRINPNYAEAYNNRGLAYSHKGEYDKAIGDYNQALRLDPNLAEAYFNRGNAYANKREPDKAIADFTQALRVYPNDAGAYTNRGAAYALKGDFARARADCEKALQINPNHTNARKLLDMLRGRGY
jgi:tetratricopeptide (TPR) repeat protein